MTYRKLFKKAELSIKKHLKENRTSRATEILLFWLECSIGEKSYKTSDYNKLNQPIINALIAELS